MSNSTIDKRHGGPYDRGRADAWYSRTKKPHYFTGGTGHSDPIPQKQMTRKQIAEYNLGYETQMATGEHKQY